MKKLALPILGFMVILLLSTCDTFEPQWMGTWQDDETVEGVVITLNFSKWEGTVRVQNNDSNDTVKLTVVDGSLDGDENTLIATIKSIYQEYWDPQLDPQLLTEIALYVFVITPPDPNDCPTCLGLEWPCSVSYHIEGETITLTGPLVSVLTDGVSDTLVAERL